MLKKEIAVTSEISKNGQRLEIQKRTIATTEMLPVYLVLFHVEINYSVPRCTRVKRNYKVFIMVITHVMQRLLLFIWLCPCLVWYSVLFSIKDYL